MSNLIGTSTLINRFTQHLDMCHKYGLDFTKKTMLYMNDVPARSVPSISGNDIRHTTYTTLSKWERAS